MKIKFTSRQKEIAKNCFKVVLWVGYLPVVVINDVMRVTYNVFSQLHNITSSVSQSIIDIIYED